MPRRPVSALAAVVLAAAALPLTACGDSGDAGGTGVQIGMEDLLFKPRNATVQVGQRVEWRNDEDAPHTVVATTGARFHSETVSRDGTFAFTPNRTGTISYVCTLHPGMTGTVLVAR